MGHSSTPSLGAIKTSNGHNRRGLALSIAIVTVVAGGCVKKSTHNRVLDQLSASYDEVERLEGELEQAGVSRAALEAELQRDLAAVQNELRETNTRLQETQSRVRRAEDAARSSDRERERVSQLLSARGQEAQDLRTRLEQLSAVEREIRERNAIYEDVIGRFQSLIEGGQLSVSIDRGRMVINLPQDILFPSGSATLGQEGRETIGQVGEVLAQIADRRFQVEGHTDNVPISTARFASNWQLSTERALSVVNLLQGVGVPPESLSGAGFAEYQPVASNDDPEGRELNRRIEIVMLPNLDVISDAAVPG